jgi:hypothetical protein
MEKSGFLSTMTEASDQRLTSVTSGCGDVGVHQRVGDGSAGIHAQPSSIPPLNPNQPSQRINTPMRSQLVML